ncbi:hypothetical protein B0H13DRAFT_1113326 [Mycena leptocephala]|nr:hypothetical protein B0H13DRAFT_1113326 [Mycena leptocephala]
MDTQLESQQPHGVARVPTAGCLLQRPRANVAFTLRGCLGYGRTCETRPLSGPPNRPSRFRLRLRPPPRRGAYTHGDPIDHGQRQWQAPSKLGCGSGTSRRWMYRDERCDLAAHSPAPRAEPRTFVSDTSVLCLAPRSTAVQDDADSHAGVLFSAARYLLERQLYAIRTQSLVCGPCQDLWRRTDERFWRRRRRRTSSSPDSRTSRIHPHHVPPQTPRLSLARRADRQERWRREPAEEGWTEDGGHRCFRASPIADAASGSGVHRAPTEGALIEWATGSAGRCLPIFRGQAPASGHIPEEPRGWHRGRGPAGRNGGARV